MKKPSQDRLRDHLYDAMPSYRLPRQLEGFIPRGKLSELLTIESIEDELMRCDRPLFGTRKHSTKAQASKIFGISPRSPTTDSGETLIGESHGEDTPTDGQSYKKILAILVLMEKASKIRSFLRAGVSDADLPLVCIKTKDSVVSWELRPEKAKDLSTGCLKSRAKFTLIKFVEYQWAVLSPFFRSGYAKRVPHQSFQKNEILPFTSWVKLRVEGGYGQVYKAEIHSDHCKFKGAGVSHHRASVPYLTQVTFTMTFYSHMF